MRQKVKSEVNEKGDENKTKADNEKPAFGIRPNTKDSGFDFKTE